MLKSVSQFIVLATLLAAAACGPTDEALDEAVASQVVTNGATYDLIGVHSGKCVDVAGVSVADRANIRLWACSGQGNQKFRFELQSDGTYRIASVHSGKCLDVQNVSTADGANVQQYSCRSGDNQRWFVTDLGGDVVRLTAKHSNKVLDVAGIGTANGTNIHQWSNTGRTNQQFRLVPTSGSSSGSAPTPTPTSARVLPQDGNAPGSRQPSRGAFNASSGLSGDRTAISRPGARSTAGTTTCPRLRARTSSNPSAAWNPSASSLS